ncbi:thioredoxin family protein [Alkalibacter rhizosphaerae]|uniref:Thioredoxin family protein n=1 Tax=Alkalibacter rhizosphaerae TaxID=2815577 RepID=A0A974XFH5_9FIRM|nr:thioredoxin family protein [Alkalibacter rhizosphaerae]QSX08863.1 thioredoxin family protein [Alkalibacter rhizosphaerae]
MLSLKDWSSIDFQLNKNRSVVLSLSSNGCNVCVAVNAKLLEVEKSYPDATFITAKLDDVPELSGRFIVFTVPTILIFQAGKEYHRESRFIDFVRLEKYLKESFQEKRPYDEGLFDKL